MEWNARTPSLWDWDSALPCDAGEYKSPGAGGDGSWAAGASTSSSGSSLRFPDVAVVPSPVLEFEVDVNHNGSALIFQDAEYSSLATVEEETSTSPPLGLKLGKRTYFEDVTPADQSAAVVSKKPRKCDQGLQQQVYCQVEGCEVELSAAKEYYRKHRVCEVHTKCPRVIVSGEERRFCQQCSRFHELLEFDQEKRSCRKRLSDHNARRRKPQPDMISFCSSIFTVSTYDDEDDDTNQISFQRDKSALHGARSSAWGFLYDSKLPQTRSWPPLVKNAGGHEVEHLPACNAQQYSTGWTALNSEVERILPLKGGTAGVLNQISSVVSSASNLEKGLDLPVALSLLSANPWPSSDPEEILTFPLQISDATSTLTQPCTHARNSQQYYCQNNGSSQSVPQQTTMLSFHMQNFNSSSRLQVYQLHKAAGLLHSRQMHPCW